jgi:alpha-galactosidase
LNPAPGRFSSFFVLNLIAFAAAFAIVTPLRAADKQLNLTVDADTGSYSIGIGPAQSNILKATYAIHVDGHWLRAADFPHHTVAKAAVKGALGDATEWSITYTGRQDTPDLICHIRVYDGKPFGEIQVEAHNNTGKMIHVESFRLIDATAADAAAGNGRKPAVLHLAGPPAETRVLSDSFSEDRPAIEIRDLLNPDKGLHRGVGSQLIYNRQSHQSWFVGTLTSDRFLSVMRLHMSPASYEVDSTGTTEFTRENSLLTSGPEDRIELSLPVPSGASLSSERLLFSVSDDYHQQLETYAGLIRDLHHARVSAPTPLGWWSWTAYYFGLNDGTARTNADWLAQHLKPLGYTIFHMDEGYQFARGEYTTPNAALFPYGIAALERHVTGNGLTPGIWTAPFEVSERSWVFEHHPEWLVKNAEGKPIHAGFVTNHKDNLYVLDVTNPDAQQFLHKTYATLKDWGIRYIKMDFMEDSAIEGFYYKPGTTALEAQRIGLKIIRDAVGEDVLLDKDGSELLNPVGIVDMGRISQDTGHTFSSSKDAAPGIAARYYMNRNFFVSDPDAFTVSSQTVDDASWHGGKKPLTLNEAKVSIALSAVSGGIFEIGDDLPTLGGSPERLALVENKDLIHIAKLGRASIPIDLMSYESEDLQPSIFLLKQSTRQSILTIFNWTESSRTHSLDLDSLGLQGHYAVSEILEPDAPTNPAGATLTITQPPHSVKMLKLIDMSVPVQPPVPKATAPSRGEAGKALEFSADNSDVIDFQWNFGDGVVGSGAHLAHAYTHAGHFTVTLLETGIDGLTGKQRMSVDIVGSISTRFAPNAAVRYKGDQ